MPPSDAATTEDVIVKTVVALLVLSLAIVAVALLVSGVIVARGVRTAAGGRRHALSSILIGSAFACAVLFAASFWSFGGRERWGGEDADPRLCGSWWEEVADHGRGVGIASQSYCYSHAVDAVVPTLGVAIASGCLAGGLAALVLGRRRRKFGLASRDMALRSSNPDSHSGPA